MSNISDYKSRNGNLSCSPEELFYFVTDIRNFERFLPGDSISDLEIGQDSCSFQVSMLGTVKISIAEKIMHSKVIFSGNALHVNDFSLIMNISETENNHAEANITLVAEMNPIFKMVAEKPIAKFLETLIDGMEKFGEWEDLKG